MNLSRCASNEMIYSSAHVFFQSAAKEVGARTGGSLDYLINNGASIITNLEQSKLTD